MVPLGKKVYLPQHIFKEIYFLSNNHKSLINIWNSSWRHQCQVWAMLFESQRSLLPIVPVNVEITTQYHKNVIVIDKILHLKEIIVHFMKKITE